MITTTHSVSGRFATRLLAGLIALVLVGLFLGGCATAPANRATFTPKEAAVVRAARLKDKIVFLSSPELDSTKPVLLLLHGATDDPGEMMDIAHEWSGKFNVLLYAYNYHKPIEKVSADFLREMKKLRTRMGEQNVPGQSLTVVTYSYSAAVFRKAVLMTHTPALFSDLSLIQLVPTAGGSYLALWMKNPVAALFVSLASEVSAVENPYGKIATTLWGEEGDRKFYSIINPNRMHTILVEGDRNSLADFPDEEIHRRYNNGNGINVVTIPKSTGATHEYFPSEPQSLEYLRKILDAVPDVVVSFRDQVVLKSIVPMFR